MTIKRPPRSSLRVSPRVGGRPFVLEKREQLPEKNLFSDFACIEVFLKSIVALSKNIWVRFSSTVGILWQNHNSLQQLTMIEDKRSSYFASFSLAGIERIINRDGL